MNFVCVFVDCISVNWIMFVSLLRSHTVTTENTLQPRYNARRYSAYSVITLISLGPQNERYNEVAV